VLDYLNQDLVGYIKAGVGISIKNQTDLLNILTQNITINKKSYDKFLTRFFYKTDGQAIDRIKNIIDEHDTA